MSARIYKVTFEMFDKGRWRGNAWSRNVSVSGGAEQAIKVANEREKKQDYRSGVPLSGAGGRAHRGGGRGLVKPIDIGGAWTWGGR